MVYWIQLENQQTSALSHENAFKVGNRWATVADKHGALVPISEPRGHSIETLKLLFIHNLLHNTLFLHAIKCTFGKLDIEPQKRWNSPETACSYIDWAPCIDLFVWAERGKSADNKNTCLTPLKLKDCFRAAVLCDLHNRFASIDTVSLDSSRLLQRCTLDSYRA